MDATINGQTESLKDCSMKSAIDGFDALEYMGSQLIVVRILIVKSKSVDYIMA